MGAPAKSQQSDSGQNNVMTTTAFMKQYEKILEITLNTQREIYVILLHILAYRVEEREEKINLQLYNYNIKREKRELKDINPQAQRQQLVAIFFYKTPKGLSPIINLSLQIPIRKGI